MLREAGHDVVTVNEVGLQGKLDPQVLDYARNNERILLTHNCRDFEALHQQDPNHQGIIAIYRKANSSKNMSHQAIILAIANLEAATVDLTN